MPRILEFCGKPFTFPAASLRGKIPPRMGTYSGLRHFPWMRSTLRSFCSLNGT
ncbi:hypothetical protein E2C01_053859 [Portunus trituberculatus]|uniref:Uncharacterized protein n=1 Tax=Portunus trituberculatus TaxID=210409 RepID=A0A5B7GIC2_PORTR|nr:hypothetical protein [Portunus trituberculatus]